MNSNKSSKTDRAEAKRVRADMKARLDRIGAGLTAEVAAVNAALRSGVEVKIPMRAGSLMAGKAVDFVRDGHDGIWVWMKNNGGAYALANDCRWAEIVTLAGLARDERVL